MFGKPWPSSRSKNIALAKEELNRYVSYCPVHEIDPTEKRKKPVVITELHNPPLPARETQRRRHGTYIDLLRPLLLSQQSYDRKMYALFNKLGLFSAYYDELKIRPEANGLIQKGKEDDVNIWRPQFHPQIGEKHYAYLLTRTMKEALKTALDSLQKERILTWQRMTLIYPNACVGMDDGEQRLGAYSEIQERLKSCYETIHEKASMNKYVEVSGKVSVIETDGFMIAPNDKNNTFEGFISCDFTDDEQKDAISKVNKGDAIVAYGKIIGMVESNGMSVLDMELIKIA